MRSLIEKVTELFSLSFPSMFSGIWRRIGIEEELVLVDEKTGESANADVIWPFLIEKGWIPEMDDGNTDVIVGVKKDGKYITTDAGNGVLEFVGTPCDSLFALANERKPVINQIKQAAQDHGLAILGYGIHPVTKPSLALLKNKARLKAMIPNFQAGDINVTISASSQAHIDVTLNEAIDAMNVFNAFSGLFISLMANSPLWQGGLDSQCRLAVRESFWDTIKDPSRAGIPLKFGSMEQYVAFMLSKQLLLLKQEGQYFWNEGSCYDCLEFFNGSASDFVDIYKRHEGTCWFSSRLRMTFGTIEIRPACQQPPKDECVVPALMLGIAQNLREAVSLMNSRSWEFWQKARIAAIHGGIKTVVGNELLLAELLPTLLDIALKGLRYRGEGEEKFLQPLFRRVEEKRGPANYALEAFKSKGIPGIIERFKY